MPELASQADLRSAQSLPFCYLCGRTLNDNAERNRDHVPPKTIFAEADRSPPLVLPTCPQCNERQSPYDEQIGQLIAFTHGKHPRPDNIRLNFVSPVINDSGDRLLGVAGLPLQPIVWRWVRGFHAALYRTLLPHDTENKSIHLPFPHVEQDGHRFVAPPILRQQQQFSEVIKQNRVTDTLDRIACYNRRCIYECVWARFDDGVPFCIFALKIYEWELLADRQHFPKRGCVGFYQPEQGRPATARQATELVFDLPNSRPLDPFET